MIHREGFASLIVGAVFCLALNALLYFFSGAYSLFMWMGVLASVLLMVALLQFFRNPKRPLVSVDQGVISPADGKVVVIERIQENEVLNRTCIQVSIFMSPTNVHVNRNPVSGKISYFKYHPGKFLVAWHPKSSTDNERTTVVYQTVSGSQVLLRQIAGAMARRIVWYLSENDAVTQGEEMGFIKFGSRVDLLLPEGSEICVKLGEKVKAASTLIARLP